MYKFIQLIFYSVNIEDIGTVSCATFHQDLSTNLGKDRKHTIIYR